MYKRQERVRQGRKLKKRTAAAALLLCMGAFCSVFASGCGRELEDRTFPSMLIDVYKRQPLAG